jgi:hypothetical protein
LAPNAQATFSALATDNLDLHQGWIALAFQDGSTGAPELVPPQAPQVISVPFDEELTTDASLVQTFPLLVGLERVSESGGVRSPDGSVLPLSAARAIVADAAGNLAAVQAPLAGGSELSTRSFSVAERGEAEGVADWDLGAGANRVCVMGRTDNCAPGTPASVSLVARASGLGGAFQKPFERVYFYVLRSGQPEWIGVRLTPQMTDGAGPLGREWSWTLDWSPPPTAISGLATLVAVGVDAAGNTLRTLDLESVTVEGGG